MREEVLILIVSRLVKVVHVQLPYEGGEIIMLKVKWKDVLSKFIRLFHNEAVPLIIPADYMLILRILKSKLR